MKKYVLLFTIATFLFVYSCSENNESLRFENYFNKSDSIANVLNSAEYTIMLSRSTDSSEFQIERHVIAVRDSTNPFGFKIRLLDNDGSIVTFNGEEFVLKNPDEQKVVLPDSVTAPADLADAYYKSLEMVIRKAHDRVVITDPENYKLLGFDDAAGERCAVIQYELKNNEENSDIVKTWFFSSKDGILRKYISEQAIGDKHENEIFLIKGLKINGVYPDSIFVQAIPDSFRVEHFEM